MSEEQSRQAVEDGRKTRHEHRRPEIVAALAEYFVNNGFAGLSLRPAAAAIGVTHSTLLRHFASKEDLVVEVVQKISKDFVTRLASAMEKDRNADIGSFIRTLWDRMNEPPERNHFLFLFEITALEGRSDVPRFKVGRTLTDDLVAPLQKKLWKDFGMRQDRAAAMAHLVAAQIRGLMIAQFLMGDRKDSDQQLEQFLALMGAAFPNPVAGSGRVSQLR